MKLVRAHRRERRERRRKKVKHDPICFLSLPPSLFLQNGRSIDVDLMLPFCCVVLMCWVPQRLRSRPLIAHRSLPPTYNFFHLWAKKGGGGGEYGNGELIRLNSATGNPARIRKV